MPAFTLVTGTSAVAITGDVVPSELDAVTVVSCAGAGTTGSGFRFRKPNTPRPFVGALVEAILTVSLGPADGANDRDAEPFAQADKPTNAPTIINRFIINRMFTCAVAP